MKWFIYLLSDPHSHHVRYVGRSKSPESRISSHKNCDSNPRLQRWIEALAEDGECPVISIVAEHDEEDEPEIAERRIIYLLSSMPGSKLFNRAFTADKVPEQTAEEMRLKWEVKELKNEIGELERSIMHEYVPKKSST